MRAFHTSSGLLASIVLALAAHGSAVADITVVNRWVLINGDTLTRANYYSQRRVRVTAPNGWEYMFNAKGDSITVIDHAMRRFWTGPRTQADSVARVIIAANRAEVAAMEAADPVAFGEKLQAFNDSIVIVPTGKQRKIAGYPSDLWTLSAGSHLLSEQWIARSLEFPNYGPEMEKSVLASIKDPMGRALMRLLIDSRAKEGTILAQRTRFRTPTREGSFEFEAVRVETSKIPASVWMLPAGYALYER